MRTRFTDHEDFLRFAKTQSGARVYLEIGVEFGNTLLTPGTAVQLAVGVDPEYKITAAADGTCRVALFRKASDAFFADGDYGKITKRRVDLSFVDGLHWCEFALRDILNAERLSHRRSAILVHDIIPGNAIEASRDRTTDTWMGDVFKAVAALVRFRPDLEVACLGDIPPSGMAVITNLDPKAQPIDMAAAEAFMATLDFDRNFERVIRPMIKGRRSMAFRHALERVAAIGAA